MNSIEPTQNTSRPTSGTENGAAKVSQTGAVQNDQQTRQNTGKHTDGQHQPDQQSGARGHSDPAVSLSASLGRLDLGATIKGTVTGLDANQQVLLKTPQGTFVLDASQIKTVLDLPPNSQLELKISAVDHVIEAQLMTKDNVKLNPPVRVSLVLVGIDGDDTLQSPSLQAGVAKVTGYGPGTPAPRAPQSGIINPAPGDNTVAVTSIRSASLVVPHSPASSAPVPQTTGTTGAPADKSNLWSLINQQSTSPSPANPNAQTANTKTGTAGVPISALPAATTSNASVYQTASQNIPNAPPLATGSLLAATVTRLAPDLPPEILAAISPANGTGKASTPEGQSLTFRVVPAPAPTSAGTIPESGAGRLTATVIDKLPPNSAPSTPDTAPARTPSPAPISAQFLATNIGVFQLTESQRLPVGQTIHLELVPAQAGKAPQISGSPSTSGLTQPQPSTQAQAPAALPAGQTEARQPLTNYLESWSTIDEIISTLSSLNPGLAAVVQNKVAGPIHNLGAKAAFLLQILGLKNSGETWLGSKTTEALLKAGRGDLINRLTDDFNRVASLGRDSSPADWKPALLPFNDGRETHALPMLVRQMRDQSEDANKRNNRDGDQDKNDATRFVIDISLSKLGPVQMDGMIKSRHFDLIMRTERTMTPHMKNEISNIFSNALANNHFAGDVVFQTGKPFPLSAAAFIAEPTNSSGGVYA